MSPLVEAAAPSGAERPAGGGSFMRALARGMRHLAPKDGSLEAYRRWLAYHEIEDDAAEWYEEMCHLNGWQPMAPAADDVGQPVPALPVLAPELEIDDMATDADDDAPSERAERIPALVAATPPPDRAAVAEQFVEWVRLSDRCGTYSDRELTELCLEFFAAERIDPIPDNRFRPALQALGDDVVSKSRADYSAGRGGRRERKRHFRWTIHDAETSSLQTLPWTELPLRQMAA